MKKKLLIGLCMIFVAVSTMGFFGYNVPTTFSTALTFLDDVLLSLGTDSDASFEWVTPTNDEFLSLEFVESNGTVIPILNIADATFVEDTSTTNDDATEPGVRLWNDTADSWSLWSANDDNPGIFIGGNSADFNIPDLALDMPITHAEDSGAVAVMNMSVSATPADGTEQSYTFQIDSNNILKIYGEADSAGDSDTHKIIAYPSATAGAGVNLTRDYASQAFTTGETQTELTITMMLDAKYITDQGGSAETDIILEAAVSYYIGCIFIDTEGNGFEVCPPSGEAIYLDGTAIAANDCVDSTGAVGAKAHLTRQHEADGTWTWAIDTIAGTWADGNDTGDN